MNNEDRNKNKDDDILIVVLVLGLLILQAIWRIDLVSVIVGVVITYVVMKIKKDRGKESE